MLADLVARTLTEVVEPVLAEISRRATPFVGVLYVGLARTATGPKVVEFNARFGDPEAQVVLPLLRNGCELLCAAATGALNTHPPLEWRPGAAVGVVVASAGSPEAPRAGDRIIGADGLGYIHAGTRLTDAGELVTTGGRALCCTAMGDTLKEARDAAYALVDKIRLDGASYRTDIARI